jgi:hypothetical protein
MNKLTGTLTISGDAISNCYLNGVSSSTTITNTYTDWDWTNPNYGHGHSYSLTTYPLYITPDIKILNVKGKVIFYYWDNQQLNYAIYKEGEKMEFKKTNDFLQVLSELGMFE